MDPNFEKRHGAGHFGNVRYGYAILGLSLLYIVYREVALIYYNYSWKKSKRSTSKLGLVHVPIQYFTILLLLVSLIVEFINMDIDHFKTQVKRFGRIAYALTPLDIFFTIRPMMFQYDNYLHTMKLHFWTSRIIVLFILAHGIGYFIIWGSKNFFKTFRPLNLLGVIMFLFIGVLAVINWRPIRSRWYNYFYIIHNLSIYLLIIGTIWHARPGVLPTAIIDIALLIYQLIIRYRSTYHIHLDDVITNNGSNYKIVKIPGGDVTSSLSLPGSHCRLAPPSKNPAYWFLPSHPYTLTGIIDEGDGKANLVIKESKFQINPYEDYNLEVGFPSTFQENFFNTAENINIVCGGSGISLGIPIFNYFKTKIESGESDILLKFIWVTPNEEDLFILKELQVTGVDIYVTKSNNSGLYSKESNFKIDVNDVSGATTEGDSNVMELENLDDNKKSCVKHGDKLMINLVKFSGRPNLDTVLEPTLSATIDYANKWIIACGPQNLIADCKEVSEKHNCRFKAEEYVM